MPTILDRLFYKVVNTTSIPIGVEGGGWWGAMKWWDPPIQKFFIANWLQFMLFSAPRVTKCGYINALSHQPVLYSDSLPAVCLAGQVGAIYRPFKHPWTTDRPMNEASVKADH